jgi:adenylate cyclase class IV
MNVEIKARVHDMVALRRRVEALAEDEGEALRQKDVFFRVPRGRLKLRFLSEGRGQLIYYEREDVAGPTSSTYHIYPTNDLASLQQVLAASLAVRGIVRKCRSLYWLQDTRVHLDRVRGLGDFVELEVVLDKGRTPAQGQAKGRRTHAAPGHRRGRSGGRSLYRSPGGREAMTGELAESVGCCGLVCGPCIHALHGCVGCRRGGGDGGCHQRACCVEDQLAGCWQCERFPCNQGYFSSLAWKGLCVGCVQAIRDGGLEAFVRHLRIRWGEEIDYGAHRFKSAQEIRQMLGRGEGAQD